MDRRALVRLLQGNETSSLSAFLVGSPAIARRYGNAVAKRRGVVCLSSRAFPTALLHRAIGFGTLAAADRATLEAVIRHYARLGLPARVELAEGVAPASAIRLLERAGFTRETGLHHVHVLESDRPPTAVTVAGLTIQRVTARTAKDFGLAMRVGFEVDGTPLGDFFDQASVVGVRAFPDRLITLLPRIDGEIAGTGAIWLSPRVAGLYSGSVFERFRGRGIQSAVIAERIRLGLARRRRIFTSQTEGDNPSAHNLHDMGLRHLYTSSYYVKPIDGAANSRDGAADGRSRNSGTRWRVIA